MLKLKNRKRLITPIIILILVVIMSTDALAASSLVQLDGGYGTVTATSGASMYNKIKRICVNSTSSSGTYITGYLKYDGYKYNDSARIYNDGLTHNVYTYLGSTKTVYTVLEAYWAGSYWASHKAQDVYG